MPQVDLETLVSACAGGSANRKITCETLAATVGSMNQTDPPEAHPDSPPESFWLSKDAEFDWWDRNAVFERNESTKGNSISTNLSPHSNSNSQRFSMNLKSKAAIIGLPLPKPQKTNFADAKNRRNHKLGNAGLMIPKLSVSVRKSNSYMIEPSSPKVSCIGRVRSKRDRSCRLRYRHRSTSNSAPAAAGEKSNRTERSKPGCFERFLAIFRSGRGHNAAQKSNIPREDSTKKGKCKTKTRGRAAKENDSSFEESIKRNSVSKTEPPGLGSMNRFTSGRRSESWGVGDSDF